jgi:hypothetical protein
MQHGVVLHRLVPIPNSNQPVALIEIDLTAAVGDGLGNIEQELADERSRPAKNASPRVASTLGS